MTMADLLLRVASGLKGLLGLSANMRRARRHDSATLFAGMASCLAQIADKLERGEEPAKECSELLYYAQVVPKNIRRIAGFWNNGGLGKLGLVLEASVDAPSTATFNLQCKSSLVLPVSGNGEDVAADPDAEVRKIRRASGLFLAASNLIQSGAKL